MRLFHRFIKLTVVTRPKGFIGNNLGFFEQLDNAINITEMRVQCTIEKNLGEHPNKCTIKISNLAEDTRAQIERDKLSATIEAGYDGVARLLFTGDIARAYSRREDTTEIVTTIEVTDGLHAYAHARMNRSYKPPIRVDRVLSDAAKSMGLTLPREVDQSPELKQALEGGISMHGPTREVLTRLLAPYGFNWSIQNGQLIIMSDEQVRAGEVIPINQGTGMINVPERTTPEKQDGKVEIKFQTLLYPEIEPGKVCRLESQLLNLDVKVTDVKHTLDTHGDDYTTDVNGRPR